jgi:hypothetical protein
MTKELGQLLVERKMLIDVARHTAGVVVEIEVEPRTPAQARKQNTAILKHLCDRAGVDPTLCTSMGELVMVLGHRGIRKNWMCDIAGIRGNLEERPV